MTDQHSEALADRVTKLETEMESCMKLAAHVVRQAKLLERCRRIPVNELTDAELKSLLEALETETAGEGQA